MSYEILNMIFDARWENKIKFIFEEIVKKINQILDRFPMCYDIVTMIFELTRCQNTRYMFLRIFGGKNFKIKF